MKRRAPSNKGMQSFQSSSLLMPNIESSKIPCRYIPCIQFTRKARLDPLSRSTFHRVTACKIPIKSSISQLYANLTKYAHQSSFIDIHAKSPWIFSLKSSFHISNMANSSWRQQWLMAQLLMHQSMLILSRLHFITINHNAVDWRSPISVCHFHPQTIRLSKLQQLNAQRVPDEHETATAYDGKSCNHQ